MALRLNQFLARAGLGSRRACEELIRDGDVTINGQRIAQLATHVGPQDEVRVRGRLVAAQEKLTAILHKPVGYVCSTEVQAGERAIFDLLPKEWPRVFYVGRLDKDSEGLLIVTNDGALAQRLTHPKFKLPKTYEVTLDREFDFEEADCLRRGINLEDGRARIDAIFRLNPRVLKVVLTQGLKRQIRLMFHAVGYNVERLVRTQVGQMKLGTLPAGQWKMIDDAEIATLLQPAPERTRSIRDLPGEKAGAAKRADRGPERSGGYRSSSRPPSSRGPRSTSRYSSPRTKSFRGDRPEYQGSSQRRAHRRPSDGSHAQSERPPSWVSRRPSEPRKRTGERPLEGSESRPPRTGPWKTRRPGGPRRQTGRHYLAEPRSRPQETRRGPSKRFAGHQRGRKGQGTQRRSSRGE